ncbi:MAG: hypothetical protein U1E76_18830 [Planctomycetota bacterium]
MARTTGSTDARFVIAAALVLVVAIGAATWFLTSPERGAPGSGATGQPYPAPRFWLPPMAAKTLQDVHLVLGFCESATERDVPELRRLALESADALVAGNAIRALGRLKAGERRAVPAAALGRSRPGAPGAGDRPVRAAPRARCRCWSPSSSSATRSSARLPSRRSAGCSSPRRGAARGGEGSQLDPDRCRLARRGARAAVTRRDPLA